MKNGWKQKSFQTFTFRTLPLMAHAITIIYARQRAHNFLRPSNKDFKAANNSKWILSADRYSFHWGLVCGRQLNSEVVLRYVLTTIRNYHFGFLIMSDISSHLLHNYSTARIFFFIRHWSTSRLGHKRHCKSQHSLYLTCFHSHQQKSVTLWGT